MNEEELWKLIEQDTKDTNVYRDRQAIQWLKNQAQLANHIERDKDMNKDERWKQLSDDIDREQFNMSRSPNNTIAHIVNDPITVRPYNYNQLKVDMIKAMNDNQRTVDMVNEPYSGPLQDNTSGYVQEAHQAHVSAHKLAIDNYNVEKQIEVLTEILDEVRAINKKLKKKVKK